MFSLRQVDDFSISASIVSIANDVISKINSKITIEIKSLGITNRFNGIDIKQTRDYVKTYIKTYINKIIRDKNWLEASIPGNNRAYVPMHHNNVYSNKIETAIPVPPSELQQVEQEFGFAHKQGIG